MRRASRVPRRGCWSALRGLSLVLILTGCASWTNAVKPSSAFADDAAECKSEAAQAALTSGQFDLDQDNASIACMRAKGLELQQYH